MYDTGAYFRQTAEYVADVVAGLTNEYHHLRPSEWAETKRKLPKSVTPVPGPFSFRDTEYWREVVDCFDPDHPARFVAIQKGAQVAGTTGVLENVFGYLVDHIRTSPGMYATADDQLTQLRLDQYMIPMLQHSDLGHVIQSNDEVNRRKQGSTSQRVEWAGGGFLIPVGAKSATKMRSFPVQYLLRDEVDGWPLSVGRDASPMKLTETRTDSFELTRKVLDLSTPLLAGVSAINDRFKLGDQRYFEVPCKHCEVPQVLRFRGGENGDRHGLVWETERTEGGRRIAPGSVRYVCPHCRGAMINEDKSLIIPEGKWRPTATASRPGFYSYHLSGLYAPHYAKSWESIALDWFDAWDDEANRMKDGEKLQVFYNNALGEAFEQKTDKLKQHQVSSHRRPEYRMGEIPQEHAEDNAGGRIQIITMAVDVQKEWLAVGIMGWAPSTDSSGYNSYLIEYLELEGNTESADAPVWQALAEIIDSKEYPGEMRLDMTVIDASYLPDTVMAFCSQWETGVYPLRGRDKPLKGSRIKEWDMVENANGVRYLSVTVDMYKDRWSPALARQWNGVNRMPRGHFSAPCDLPDKVINHLTVEYKREKRDPSTNRLLGTYWHRPNNARQELWDLLMYNTAALEAMVYDVCANELGLEALVWGEFWHSLK